MNQGKAVKDSNEWTRLLRDRPKLYKRLCSEKHCTFPTQNIVIIDVETINSLIQEELLFPITIISCLRLFVNSLLTDW